MIETTTPEDRKQSTRRIFVSDGFTEYEVAVTLRQDLALPDEPTDLRITGEIPLNGQLADALVEVAATLNRSRHATSLPNTIASPPPSVLSFGTAWLPVF